MHTSNSKRSIATWLIAGFAILFGLLTLKSGGAVIFIDGPARVAAGNYLPFVVWFNFLTGFAYIIAGVGIWLNTAWARPLALLILIATLVAFAILGVAIINGSAYESRTIAAMSLRSVVWALISVFLYKKASRV